MEKPGGSTVNRVRETDFPLSGRGQACDFHAMSSASEIQNLALKLPKRSRLKLAGELLRSVETTTSSADLLAEADRRDAEIENGSVKPLGESEFWDGIRRRGNRS